jgi:aspartate kinase
MIVMVQNANNLLSKQKMPWFPRNQFPACMRSQLARIPQARRAGFSRVVVVSALAKVTDQLILLGKAAGDGRLETADQSLLALRQRHERLARELLNRENYLRVYVELQRDFLAPSNLLHSIAESGQFSLQSKDYLSGFGECLSSRIVSAALRQAEEDAVWIDSRSCIVTDSRYTHATPLWEQTREGVERLLTPLLAQGRVPVMGGFIAANADGIPTTLGRGGSDFTATILGALLQAHRIEIWTDVDGILTADPKLCPNARLIPKMSFHEASELAQCGAKVLQPSSLLPAMRENIPVFVLNSRNPANRGTEIVTHVYSAHGVRSIAVKRNVAVVEIELGEQTDARVLDAVFRAFYRRLCTVDLMECFHGRIRLVVGSTASLPAIADDLSGVARMGWENHRALVCLVGENISRQPEIASLAFAALSDLDVRLACQNPSDRTISFLVDESGAEESVQRLHNQFFPPSEVQIHTTSDYGADPATSGSVETDSKVQTARWVKSAI